MTGVIRATSRPRPFPAILPAGVVAVTAALLATRAFAAGSDPLEWIRVAVGVLSLATLLALRSGGFARAAACAFAIECAGGTALFLFVDAPVIQAHVPAIVQAVAAVAPHGLR